MSPNRSRLLAYAAISLPLTMAALPVYVLAPKFYADETVLSLALIGVLLLGARVVDAVQDPLFGVWSDRARLGRRGLMALGIPLLALGFIALFNPPPLATAGIAVWMTVSLILAYSGYSLIAIPYHAWGAELAPDAAGRTRITAAREAFSLIGVMLAAMAPPLLVLWLPAPTAMTLFSGAFVVLLFGGALITLSGAPRVPFVRPERTESWWPAVRDPAFRRLAVIFLLNGTAAAVPATLFLFYVEGVLQRPGLAGPFLVAYFLAGVAGMPLWVRLGRRLGVRQAWLSGMLVAIGAFAWAFTLGEGDVLPFLFICLLSGLALGADLALPPVLLAGIAPTRATGSYFGLWTLLGKLSLALAAGLSLPLLQLLGYTPGEAQGLVTLAAVYALLPCALKLLAALALWRWHAPASAVSPQGVTP
ncbi:MAG: MFS transporter [Ectothiorhodospiraceae bacterium]|nr:MFS transporter [Ectothiorhodospiraceae bacterium]